MTDLTEQWKKGELSEGVYYVLYYGNDTAEVDIYRRVYSLYEDSEVRFTISQVTEVLAPVPSFEKWEKFRNALADNQIENSNLLIENTKLKGLLELAKSSVSYHCALCREYTDGQILLSKINQALGEE